MPDYQKGKIYKIIDNTNGDVYYGSTCEPTVARRLAKHINSFKCFLNGKSRYMTSYDIFANEDYEIILVETYPCMSKDELTSRERFYIENNDCVNKCVPSRTKKEYRMYNREYRENNKEVLTIYNKEYREQNREVIMINKKEYYEKNKEAISMKGKEYYENNKEVQLIKAKEYREKNREAILIKKKEYYERTKDAIKVKRQEKLNQII